jgi:hypothetical protein
VLLTFPGHGNNALLTPLAAGTRTLARAGTDLASPDIGRVVRARPLGRPPLDGDAAPSALTDALVETDAARLAPEG